MAFAMIPLGPNQRAGRYQPGDQLPVICGLNRQ